MISFKALEANSVHQLDPRRHFKILLDLSCVTAIGTKNYTYSLETIYKVQATNEHKKSDVFRKP